MKQKIVVDINIKSKEYCFGCDFFNNLDDDECQFGIEFCYRFMENKEEFQQIYDKKRCPQCLEAQREYEELNKGE